MSPFSLGVVSLLLAVSGVDAGSRAWQPPIVHAKAAIAVRDVSGINNIYSNGTNGSSHHHAHTHQKRYYGITNPANTGPYPRLWPNGNIDACFEQVSHTHKGETKTTRQILYDDLITARELWRGSGLDDKDGHFQFNILADNDPGCARELRSTHLFIQYAGEGVRQMSTTVGVDQPRAAPESNKPLKDLGPSMTLTDILDIGMENVVANYAHEMGVSGKPGCLHESCTDILNSTPGVCTMSTRTPSGGKKSSLRSSGITGFSAKKISSARTWPISTRR